MNVLTVSHFLGFEKRMGEQRCEVPDFTAMLEGHHFSGDVATLQCDDAVRQGIPLCTVNILTHECYKVGHRHDGAANHKIIAVFFFHCIPV